MYWTNTGIVLGVIYTIFILIIVILTMNKDGFSMRSFVGIIIFALYSFLIVYDVNCVFTGYCDLWGIIKAFIHAFVPIIVIIVVILNFPYILQGKALVKDSKTVSYSSEETEPSSSKIYNIPEQSKTEETTTTTEVETTKIAPIVLEPFTLRYSFI